MNCDNFLPFLETGGPLRRLQARRHAARCPRCGLIYSKFSAVKQQLAAPDELTTHVRQLWHRAAHDSAVQPAWRHPWAPVVVALATAACVMVAVIRLGIRDGNQRNDRVKDIAFSSSRVLSPTTVVELDPTAEIVELAAAADQLYAELRTLRDLVERLDAEREVAMTLTRYGQW
jgi:hypothetical protein